MKNRKKKCKNKCFCSSRRRRVSNLLSSSFRENLDRLLQSYVERQGRAEIEWELQEITPDSVQEDLERQAWDQIGEESAADTALLLPSSPTPSQPLWDPQLRHDNWPQNDMNNQYNGNVRSFSSVIARIDLALCKA